MSRVDFIDSEGIPIGLWMGIRDRTFAGKKGQAFLKNLEQALTNWPHKKLMEEEVVSIMFDDEDNKVVTGACAIGVMALDKGEDPSRVSRYEGIWETCELGQSLGSTWSMAWIIAEFNDSIKASEEDRYEIMLAWVRECIEQGQYVSTWKYRLYSLKSLWKY